MWKNIKIDEDFTLNVLEADEQQSKANICLKTEDLPFTNEIKTETCLGHGAQLNESGTSGVVSDFLPNHSVKKEPQVIDLTNDDLCETKKEPICEINLTHDEDLIDAKIEIKAPVVQRSEFDVIVIPDEPEIDNRTKDTSVGREIVKQIINSITLENAAKTAVPDPVTRPAITVRSPDVTNCGVRLVPTVEKPKETVETRLPPLIETTNQNAPIVTRLAPLSGETNPALQVSVIAQNPGVKKTNGEIVGDALRSLLTAQSPQEQETIGKLLKNLLSEDQGQAPVVPSGGSLVRNLTSSSCEFQTPPKKTQTRPKKNNATKNSNSNKKSAPKAKTKIVMTPTGVKIADPQILFLNGRKETKRTSDFFVGSNNSKRSLDSQLKDKKNETPLKKHRTESLHTLPTTSPKSKTSNWVQDHFNVGEKPKKRGRKPAQAQKTRARKPQPRRPRKQPETPVMNETVPTAINDTCKIIGEFLNGVFNPNSVQGETLPSFLGRCYGTQLVNMYLSLNGKKQSGQ